jgi:hypothetical protein
MTSGSDIVFNGNTFVDNLKLILSKDVLDITPAALDSRKYMDTTFAGKSAAGFLATISTDTNPLLDWSSFLAAWKTYSGDTTNDLLAKFVKDFKTMINYQDGNPSGSDWHALSSNVNGSGNDADGFPKSVDDALIEEYFKRSFSSFVGAYPYVDPNDESKKAAAGSKGIVGSTSTAGDNFFTSWTQFMARTSEFDDGTTTTAVPDIAAYEKVYSIFFPAEAGETPADVQARYVARLRKFWKEQALVNGAKSPDNAWFIPSQSFDEWFEELRDDFIQGKSVKSTQLTTVGTPATERVLVIDRILRLLIQIIDVLQRISAAQSQRLSFLTTWQQAYTDMITQVPQFAQGDGTPLGTSSSSAKAFRNKDVNPHMQSVLEKVRARRSAVQDEAKQTQTTINQSQDASNQQTQMATSLIQQLSTILSQIFR